MPKASEILSDPFMHRYGAEDMFRVYYTCFPVDKHETLHECLPGKFDACYSDKFFWTERNWPSFSVPKFIPKRYHSGYLQYKSNLNILQIHHGK